ncbi:hypothetical protein J3R74_000871 [Puniceicoccus vermicola]
MTLDLQMPESKDENQNQSLVINSIRSSLAHSMPQLTVREKNYYEQLDIQS